jgi:hypothetical protein
MSLIFAYNFWEINPQQGVPFSVLMCRILTTDSIVICQTHTEDLRQIALKMHPGLCVRVLMESISFPEPAILGKEPRALG